MKTLIIGNGEIGQSLFNVLNPHYQTFVKDVEDLEVSGIEVMHICFPYSKNFNKSVKKYQKKYNPKFTVIHSTVPVGTSTKLNAFHSPVRGVHPHLERSLKTFVKFLAPKNKVLKEYFEKAGIKIELVEKSEETELLKLYCTTIYGLNIVAEKEVYAKCKELKLNFDVVYTRCNQTYNEGYEKLGFPQYKKYVLKHIKGGIGGHCVINNCWLLKTPTAKFIYNSNQNKKLLK